MKRYKGAIFDLDGTLLNTLQDLSDSVNLVLDAYGYPVHNYEEYKLKIGKGFRNLLESSFPAGKWNEIVIDKALLMFLNAYDRRYMNKTAPYEGIISMLQELKDKKIKIGVNSNKRDDYSNALINKHFVDIPFIGIFGERQGVAKKPEPQAALELAGLMSLNTTEILYIGDSKTDMQTGKNAGMDTLGVLWGFREREELIKYGATYIAETPKEILTMF